VDDGRGGDAALLAERRASGIHDPMELNPTSSRALAVGDPPLPFGSPLPQRGVFFDPPGLRLPRPDRVSGFGRLSAASECQFVVQGTDAWGLV
jgi:hypothetical protein